MKKYVDHVKQYVKANSDAVVGASVVAGLFAIVAIVALISHFSGPMIVYQPAKACEWFTVDEARSLLGEDVLNTESNKPVIDGDVAVSKCGYTDTNGNSDAMKVAAVAIRSGINDAGQAKNETDFAAAKSSNIVDDITGIGDAAYFNKTSGQLNVLNDKKWIIINYGFGATPEANTAEDAIIVAKKVLQTTPKS